MPLTALTVEQHLKFVFNGFPEEFAGSCPTVEELLDHTQENHSSVIVEINGRFVNRRDYMTRRIAEGDRVEFIHPCFGG
jgi:thiamine biosynthesis protein ThiS